MTLTLPLPLPLTLPLLALPPLSLLHSQYAVSAMSTYLHAVSVDHDPRTRLVLARVIRLLQVDDPSERLSNVFANHIEQTPMWSWIVWVPQLLVRRRGG